MRATSGQGTCSLERVRLHLWDRLALQHVTLCTCAPSPRTRPTVKVCVARCTKVCLQARRQRMPVGEGGPHRGAPKVMTRMLALG